MPDTGVTEAGILILHPGRGFSRPVVAASIKSAVSGWVILRTKVLSARPSVFRVLALASYMGFTSWDCKYGDDGSKESQLVKSRVCIVAAPFCSSFTLYMQMEYGLKKNPKKESALVGGRHRNNVGDPIFAGGTMQSVIRKKPRNMLRL